MSTTVGVVLSVAVAGLLAWSVRRLDVSREPSPTVCSKVLDDVFANGASATADSVLLARLMEHEDACIGDAMFVDQVRRLMLNTQQIPKARALLEEAERSGAFAPDEMKAQIAWVDLDEAHVAWTNSMESRAKELHTRAVATANDLRARWPEWPLPYLLLDEAGTHTWADSSNAVSTSYFQLGRDVRAGVLSGAFLREFSEWQPVAFAFVVAAVGMLALCAGVSGLTAMRGMTSMPTSPIGSAASGYVELIGTLHVEPNAAAVIGPQSRQGGVWYETSTNSGSKGATTQYQRSAQPFVLRDATGEAVIDPRDMTVHTRHSITSYSTGAGLSSGRRSSERLLKEGDQAYVLGELAVDGDGSKAGLRRIRVAADGRQLLVSNFDEKQLMFMERIWFWLGTIVFLTATIVLAWSYYQRYHVRTEPGRVVVESGGNR